MFCGTVFLIFNAASKISKDGGVSKKKAISLGMIVMFIGVWGYHLWFQRKPIVLQHTATPVSLATVSTHLIPLTVPAVGTVQAQ